MLLIYLIFFLTGIFSEIQAISIMAQAEQQFLLEQFIQSNFAKLFTSIGVFILATFFFGASMNSFKLTFIKNAILNKKKSVSENFKESKKFYWRLISVKILTFLIIIISLIILIILLAILEKIIPYGLSVKLAIAAILVVLIYLSIFFRNAILFIKNTKSVEAIKKSISFFKKNFIYTIFIIIFILVVNIVWMWISKKFPAQNNILTGIYVIIFLAISLWTDLFTFNTYHSKKPKKKKRKSKR